MADAALEVRSPLEGFAFPAGPRFALAEVPPAARFILRGAEAVRVACGMAFGVEPPSRLGPAGESEGRAALWLGPDEWLLIADGADAADIGAMLESVLEGTAHSLVDVSHRQIALIASGPTAARVLNAGCPLDLDLKAFPVGFATRTLFDKVEIVLWRRAETTFHIEIWRSFAPFLVGSLAEAARGAPEW
ncbi:MAG TPA: sarcosine oxidase subunit gamma family protein [Roseiarcus sp.]|nr:sarcosine oxidase subunit gamma family protein [Roseiarcus sp.]